MRRTHVYILLFVAFLTVAGSWVYTLILVKQLSQSERERITLWAQAYREVQNIDVNQQISPLVLEIIRSNTTIPVILADNKGKIISYANLDSLKSRDSAYLYRQLKIMKDQHKPIVIDLGEGVRQYLYYKDSFLLTALYYYPIIQFIVVVVFLIVIFFAGTVAAKAEENKLWVLMSKETAHQLGTPISSLMAWVEMIKMTDIDPRMKTEVEKDVARLEAITERFSSIGTMPKLEPADLSHVIDEVIDYLRSRTSKKISYKIHIIDNNITVNLNKVLFQWVIENLAKNAIDAMEGQGTITITARSEGDKVIIDFSDEGKGIQGGRRHQKQIFNPGFSTKKHGWGMGLALVKRIIQDYHKGKIFVLRTSSQGTTFRIILNRSSADAAGN